MRLWIFLGLAAVLTFAIVTLEDASTPSPTASVEPKTDVINSQVDLTPEKVKTFSRPSRSKPRLDQAEAAAADETASNSQEDSAPDLLKWDGDKSSDPVMELRSSHTLRPKDGPVLTLTFGDVPVPNVKVERRDWGIVSSW